MNSKKNKTAKTKASLVRTRKIIAEKFRKLHMNEIKTERNLRKKYAPLTDSLQQMISKEEEEERKRQQNAPNQGVGNDHDNDLEEEMDFEHEYNDTDDTDDDDYRPPPPFPPPPLPPRPAQNFESGLPVVPPRSRTTSHRSRSPISQRSRSNHR